MSESIIVFYEGNDATQNIVHSTNDAEGQNFAPNKNDEARSVKLTNVRGGCKITVFDNPDAEKSDDWCIVEVLKHIDNDYIVKSFEKSYKDDFVNVEYTRNNGLDGKISRITIN